MYYLVLVILLVPISGANRCGESKNGNSHILYNRHNSNLQNLKGKSILERCSEGLYWSTNQIFKFEKYCLKGSIDNDILKKAAKQAVSTCQTVFKFEPWNCTFSKESFRKTSRETGLLYATLTSSLAYVISKECARGSELRKFCGGCDRNWPHSNCHDDIQSATLETKKFFSLRAPPNSHLHHKVLVHNSLLGLEILKASGVKKCKCHGFSGACSSQTCWITPSPFTLVLTHLKTKYQLAQKWHFSNRIDGKNHKGSHLGYIDQSEDFCQNVGGRSCSDVDNCRAVCCGRNYTVQIAKRQHYCNCRWGITHKLDCDVCLRFVNEFECR